MKTKKTIETHIEKYEQNSNIYGVSRKLLLSMANKHKVDVNKLLIGMQYGNMVVQVYDEGAYPVWQTLEIITFIK